MLVMKSLPHIANHLAATSRRDLGHRKRGRRELGPRELGPRELGPRGLPWLRGGWLCGVLLVGWAVSLVTPAWAEDYRRQAAQLGKQVDAAGQLFAAGSYAQSAEKITQVQQQLSELARGCPADQQPLLKPLYARLQRARELLELQGAQLQPLLTWDALTAPPPTSTAAATSFAADVAPILTANCQGCHIGGRQASGGLRMDTFEQLLRGGDSGPSIAARQAAESLLVLRLRGQEGDRMPPDGRPALSESEIAVIAAWIDQGAVFDGPSPESNLEAVVGGAWASAADHAELFSRRRELALAHFAQALPNDQPSTAQTEELFVLGNAPPETLQAAQREFEAALQQAKRLLRLPADQPLLKGGLSVFVLGSRYDYSEFGRMIERRELPASWWGHWRTDAVDAYAALPAELFTASRKPSDKLPAAVALQLVAGASVGAGQQVPVWFAEGVARNLVKEAYRRSDQRIAEWQQAYPAAVQKVDQPQKLLAGNLDEETAGLVGMGLSGQLMERTQRRRFEQLLQRLRDGQPFDAACAATFAPPETLLKTWLGK